MNAHPDTFAFVQFHRWDAYETSWGIARYNFYGFGGTPSSVMDGSLVRAGNWGYATYSADYYTRRDVATDVTITLAGEHVSGSTYDVRTTVCIEGGGGSKTMRIHTVQVLDYWPSYGGYHRNGFKQAPAYQDVPVNAGECVDVFNTFTFDGDSMAAQDDIKIIAWAQQTKSSGPSGVWNTGQMGWPFPPMITYGDFDDDTDIDEDDAYEFQNTCYSGPGGGVGAGCEPGDFDGDDDVDCDDWEAFKLAWTGPPTYPTFYEICDDDCNSNEVADEFDIDGGTSSDANENGIPDECDILPLLPENSLGITDCEFDTDCANEANCVNGTCYAPKHRYISIARNPDQVPGTARRVSVVADPEPVVLGWVGEPYEAVGLSLADIVAAPAYIGVWPDLLAVSGCAIATNHTYLVQAIAEGQEITDEANYSTAIALHTPSVWGDVVSTCTAHNCDPPEGEVNIDDILAVIGAFRSLNNDPLTWFDIAPALGDGVPNQMVDIDDILATIQGFQSKAYPGLGPLDCP